MPIEAGSLHGSGKDDKFTDDFPEAAGNGNDVVLVCGSRRLREHPTTTTLPKRTYMYPRVWLYMCDHIRKYHICKVYSNMFSFVLNLVLKIITQFSLYSSDERFNFRLTL